MQARRHQLTKATARGRQGGAFVHSAGRPPVTRSRQLLDAQLKAIIGRARTRPTLRELTEQLNLRLTHLGLPSVGCRTVDLRMKALYGVRWARRPSG